MNVGVKTPVANVTVAGRTVPIYGTGQPTGTATCPGAANMHAQASETLAKKMAATGDYEYLTLNRRWSTATGASPDIRPPDVIGVRCDGRVDAWEVLSKGDTVRNLKMRVDAGMATLPTANQGMTDVVNPVC